MRPRPKRQPVGTRSTAFLTSPKNNRTRWNASLPGSGALALWGILCFALPLCVAVMVLPSGCAMKQPVAATALPGTRTDAPSFDLTLSSSSLSDLGNALFCGGLNIRAVETSETHGHPLRSD